MKLVVVAIVACSVLSGCAGNSKYEQLAKCSDDENPAPALTYGQDRSGNSARAMSTEFAKEDCGPMRPANPF